MKCNMVSPSSIINGPGINIMRRIAPSRPQAAYGEQRGSVMHQVNVSWKWNEVGGEKC
jgi:hypothetical protein